jgi:hypothetical protein
MQFQFGTRIVAAALIAFGFAGCGRDASDDPNVTPFPVDRPEAADWQADEGEVTRQVEEWAPGARADVSYDALEEPTVRAESVWDLDKYFEGGFDKDKFIELHPDDPPVRVGQYRYLYRYPYVYQLNDEGEVLEFRAIGVKNANELVIEDITAPVISKREAVEAKVPLQK